MWVYWVTHAKWVLGFGCGFCFVISCVLYNLGKKGFVNRVQDPTKKINIGNPMLE